MASYEEYQAARDKALSPRGQQLLSGQAFHTRRSPGAAAYQVAPELQYNPHASGTPYGLEHGLSVPGNPEVAIAHAQQQSEAGRQRMLDMAYRVSQARADRLPDVDPEKIPVYNDPISTRNMLVAGGANLGAGGMAYGYNQLDKMTGGQLHKGVKKTAKKVGGWFGL